MSFPLSRSAARWPAPWPWVQARLWLALGALVFGLAACGGGGGVGIEGTGSEPPTYADGPISGFGSIIVNGVHYDDATAKVEDRDGGTRSAAELKLGMVVRVDAGAVAADAAGVPRAAASLIRVGSELIGPVEAVDSLNGRIVVLGQQVRVSADTVFDDRLSGGVAGLAVGRLVEVYGLHDPASQGLRATRIEPVEVAANYRLRGTVAVLDTAARTLRVGGLTVHYGSVAAPATLAVGEYVRLTLGKAPDSTGHLPVLSFGTALAVPTTRTQAEVRGVVDRFTAAGTFRVNGIEVSASTAQFPDGTAGLGLGARVEVKGTIVGGVLVATRVEIETDEKIEAKPFEIEGRIDSVNVTAKTLVVRGITIDWSDPALRLDDGSLADLVAGRKIEVRGLLSPDRTRVLAQRIKIES